MPSDADGEVSRTACIVGFNGPCSKTITIKVKSCGNYRVYYLVPVPQTSTGYCIGILIQPLDIVNERHLQVYKNVSYRFFDDVKLEQYCFVW